MFDYLIALSTLSWLSFKVLADWASLANSSQTSSNNSNSNNNNLVGRSKPQNTNRTEGNWDLGIGELGEKSTFFRLYFIILFTFASKHTHARQNH